MRTPSKILGEAKLLVSGDRTSHGDYIELHNRIAELWGTHLKTEIAPEQVAFCMVLLKLARQEVGKNNYDNLLDAVAYSGIWGELLNSKSNIYKINEKG